MRQHFNRVMIVNPHLNTLKIYFKVQIGEKNYQY